MRRLSLVGFAGVSAYFGLAVAAGCDPTPSLPPAATDGGAPAECGAGQTCHSDRCVVSVPQWFPRGLRARVVQEPAPASLDGDVIAPYVCRLTVPNLPYEAPVRLSIALDRAPPDAVIFRDGEGGRTALDSTASTVLVEALARTSGVYGATLRPGPWKVASTFTNDPLSSADPASLFRNLTLQPMSSAFFDGRRLYVGNGPRVLVYDGIPAHAGVKPALVLGQPDLDTIRSGTTASQFGASGVAAIWSDGTRLVVAESQRVLIWNKLPAASFTPADLVLGQQDFVSNTQNVGGISASTLFFPYGVDSDGTRLVVADAFNHRVLAWDEFPTRIGQPATSVLGQGSFSTGDIGLFYRLAGVQLDGDGVYAASTFSGAFHFASLATNAAPDYLPIDNSYPLRIRQSALFAVSNVQKLPSGGLAMSDYWGSRVGIQRAAASSAKPLDFVLGQPDPNRAVTSSVSASTFRFNSRVFVSGGKTMIPDGQRLLIWDHEPAYNFDPADRVLGEPGFSVNDQGTDYRWISERTLGHPADVATNGSVIAVADRGNNRVLVYPASSLPSASAAATVVLGQPDMTSFVPNVDQQTPSARTLSGPSAVAIDGQRLIVADTENHRVLVWSPVPTSSNTPATIVLGQADFAGRRPNRGAADADADGYADATSSGLFAPSGVATDGTHLVVSDRLNHRVLVWDNLATVASGAPADHVIGQASFGEGKANRGAGLLPTASSLSLPTGVTLDGSSLWVADTENNRVVRYDDVFTSPVAGQFLGQASGSTLANPNSGPDDFVNPGWVLAPPTTETSVLRPRAIALTSTRIYVSERDSNRVHVFDKGTGLPIGQLGQSSPTRAVANAGGIGAASLASPEGLCVSGSTLYVADAANHRVLAFSAEGALVPQASAVIGQSLFVANGFNRALATTAGGSTRPRGIALDGGELFVAERSRNRVVVHELPLVPGKQPKRVLGQSDPSVSLPNAGGAASASTLASPSGVFVDSQRVVVADTANNRVLVYGRQEGAAALVLGQSAFDATQPNRGGAAGAGTLAAPESVFTDGTRLVVADTGNHRVLVWTSFPTSSGQPADLVIGQPDSATTTPNGGSGAASASTLAGPSAVWIVDGRLYVADTGNNRVLVFFALPTTSGAAASAVLGQPDFSGRVPASDPLDRQRLAGPVALASDGANLYVADRDGNRVLAFAVGAAGSAALAIYGSGTGLSTVGPSGLAVERTPTFGSRLFIADTNRDQLLVLENVSRLR